MAAALAAGSTMREGLRGIQYSQRELTSVSIDSQSADRVSARGEETKASVLDMISDRHVYGNSMTSEVCTERAGKRLYGFSCARARARVLSPL